MSHTTTLKGVKITSVSALRAAVAALREKGRNIELVENAKPRMYYDNQEGNCPFVLKLKDARYDVGLRMAEDGSYTPVLDTWGGHVSRELQNPKCDLKQGQAAEAAISLFTQEYAKAASTEAMLDQGFHVAEETQDEQGNYILAYER